MSWVVMKHYVKRISAFTAFITVINYSITAALDRYRKSNVKEPLSNGAENGTTEKEESLLEISSTHDGYRATNFVVNLFLGTLGLVCWFYVIPSSCTGEEAFGVLFDRSSLIGTRCHPTTFFSEFQIAYQLWSLPMAMLTEEQTVMVVHHYAVLFISLLNLYSEVGDYYTVFFFGVVETSSVFLSIMNTFKSHPSLISRFPAWFATSKILFGVTFLVTRVLLWLPNTFEFVWLSFKCCYVDGSLSPIIVVLWLAAFIPNMFLTVLQLWWGYKVVKGLCAMCPS